MKIRFSKTTGTDTDLYLIGVPAGIKTSKDKIVKTLLAANPAFKGNAGEIVTGVMVGGDFARYGLVGLGDVKKASVASFEEIGGAITAAILGLPVIEAFVDVGDLDEDKVGAMAFGAKLRAYEFRKYKTRQDPEVLPDAICFGNGSAKVKAIYKELEAVCEAVHWARDVVNEPPNVMTPDVFAKAIKAAVVPYGVKVNVVTATQLSDMGADGILSVGVGSQHAPCMVVLEYMKGGKGAPVALVGKGITFDTGGYSIKSGQGMLDMHTDMAGGAAVVGAIQALASGKAKVNVVGVIAIAENMIGGDAYKPTDIIPTLSGQTIEVTNTDAEGRIVLADAMWYVQETYKPKALLDIATLTGAALSALGESYAAVFANDEKVYEGLAQASSHTGDRIWRMPLNPDYHRALKSNVADMKNAPMSRWGGACTAAAFLEKFVMTGTHWAHIDMAPVGVAPRDSVLCPQGPTGFGVRLLSEFVKGA